MSTHICSLGFISKEDSESGVPELVVSFYQYSADRMYSELREYFKFDYSPDKNDFVFGENDRIGYQGCCRIKTFFDAEGMVTRVYFEISKKNITLLWKTLHKLDVITGKHIDNAGDPKVHKMNFYVYPDAGTHGWVADSLIAGIVDVVRGDVMAYKCESKDALKVSVEAAMREVVLEYGLSKKENEKRYLAECKCLLSADGRFCLFAPPDSSDLSTGIEESKLTADINHFTTSRNQSHYTTFILLAGLGRMFDLLEREYMFALV